MRHRLRWKWVRAFSRGPTLVFEATNVDGAWILGLEPREDARGFFARSWCRRELEERGLVVDLAQANVAYTRRRGTLRGMHYQVAPHEETKLVRCSRGAIWDVVIDLRPESHTYLQWCGVELTADNRRQLYVPKGCAHGYQTLEDDSEVFYLVSEFYAPGAERGVRWNDPQFAITWPACAERDISPKDQQWPDYLPERSTGVSERAVSSQGLANDYR